MPESPILYSFRRCPYAMRARLAIAYSQIFVELREVVLRNKPIEMIQISPKATVPVLQLEHQVIDESLDIMDWAIAQHDPFDWAAAAQGNSIQDAMRRLIEENDFQFKPLLDRYKYFERYPENSQTGYREQAMAFVLKLEQKLGSTEWLFGASPTLADMAILPFIRQFAHVDKDWFFQAPFPCTQRWLTRYLNSPANTAIMKKYPPWQSCASAVYFSE